MPPAAGVPSPRRPRAWVPRRRPGDADRLAGGLDLLSTTAPDVERRHQSLRSVIDWSWQLLTEDERRVLARLSVQRGGFDLEAAAAVAGASLPLLAALVDHSLVDVGEGGRYGMHELLRQYAPSAWPTTPPTAGHACAPRRALRRALPTLPSGRPVAGTTSTPRSRTPRRHRRLVANADPARLDATSAGCAAVPPQGWFARPGRS